jgi:hypothetical protein
MGFERHLRDNSTRIQLVTSIKTEALQIGYLSPF